MAERASGTRLRGADVRQRFFAFAVEVVELGESLRPGEVTEYDARSLVRSGTTVGARYERFLAAEDPWDRGRELRHALRLSNEVLRALRRVGEKRPTCTDVRDLVAEATELRAVLATIAGL